MIKPFVFCFSLFLCYSSSFSSFMNLRYEKTNFRYGPEMTFPLKFTWNAPGLPVEILKEQGEWVYVQDSEGEQGWLQRRMLSKKKLGMLRKDVEMRDDKNLQSPIVAFPKRGVLVTVKKCDGSVCKVQVPYKDKKIIGWVPKQCIWGVA